MVSSYCRSAAQLLSSPALNLEHLSVIAWHDTLDLYDHVPWSTLTSFNLRSFTCIDVEARLLSTIIAALDRAHNLHAVSGPSVDSLSRTHAQSGRPLQKSSFTASGAQ